MIEDWTGSSWDSQSRTIQTFDGDGKVVEAVVQQRDAGAWFNLTKTINTYNADDRLVQAVTETWDGGNDKWEKASRTTNT